MIIGNPDEFAIIIDVVKQWNNDKSFNNGLFFMCVDGTLIPKKITVSTLNTEIFHLVEKLKNPMENIKLFHMAKEAAFSCIYDLTFPRDYNVDNDYSYNITPFEFENNNYFIFMVSDGHKVRILASELQYIFEESVHNLHELEVIETYICVEKLQELTKELNLFWMQIRA